MKKAKMKTKGNNKMDKNNKKKNKRNKIEK